MALQVFPLLPEILGTTNNSHIYSLLEQTNKAANIIRQALLNSGQLVLPTIGKDAVVSIGDSIERADQATQEAGFDVSSANQQAYTTAFQSANGATGNQGRQTSTERSVDLVNAQFPNRLDAYSVGYPGKTSFYFRRTYLANFFSTFDFTKYDNVLVLLAFGANDLIYPDQQSDSVDPIAVADNIIYIAQQLKAVNPKIKVAITPTLNRTYNNPSPNGPQQAEFANYDTKRQRLNNSLLTRITSFAVGATNIFNQSIGLASMPFSYPNQETGDGSHPTVKGQGEIALEKARLYGRVLNFTLSQGNGSEPTPPIVNTPNATIGIDPISATTSTSRAFSVSISNDPGVTSVEYYHNTSNSSSGGTLIGTGSSSPFTINYSPLKADGADYFYAKLIYPSGSFLSDIKRVLYPVSYLVYNYRNNFSTQNSNGDMTKSGGNQATWSGQGIASRKIAANSLPNSGISFMLARPTSTSGSIIGFQVDFTHQANEDLRQLKGFYSDQDKYFLENLNTPIFPTNNNPTLWADGQTSMKVTLKLNTNFDIDVFLDDSTSAYGTIPGFGNVDIYVAVAAATDGVIIPGMTIFGSNIQPSNY